VESEGSLEASGEGGVVNCAGRGEHVPEREMLSCEPFDKCNCYHSSMERPT
jgi:hypothetical protein